MAAPFSVPLNVPLRLTKVEELTGVPETTLRDAIREGELKGKKKKGAWHTRLEDFNAWFEKEEKAKSRPRLHRDDQEREDQGDGDGPRQNGHQPGDRPGILRIPNRLRDRSVPAPTGKAGRTKRRPKPVIFDLREKLAE